MSARVKVAVTLSAVFIVIEQVSVPEHPPPDQPEKIETADGMAVRVTVVPVSKLAEQVEPQLIPGGMLVTVPKMPDFSIVSKPSSRIKLAVTLSAALIVIEQAPVPEHPPPDQPVKVESEDGVAVRVTVVPAM